MRNLGIVLLSMASLAAAQTRSGPPARPAPAPAPAAARTSETVPAVKDLKFPALRTIAIPSVESFSLPNGMHVFLLEDHEFPLVHGAARIRTGNLFDPADKIGLATITGMVMRTGGTKQKTGDQLDVDLENVAATVETSIDETYGSATFNALTENTDQVMSIFHDVLTAPEFRQDKIDLAKDQIDSSIARRNDDAHGIGEREFNSILYGRDTPYGWEEEYATVARVSRPDLEAFYQRYFFPSNVMLAVWGDFKSPEMKAKLEKMFADWTATQPPVPAFPKVTGKPAPGIFLAAKEDVDQTFFTIGQWGGELRDPDYPALEIMSDILGGGFQSRLFERVRTKMGNAYQVGAYWGANYDHPGLFQISGSTKSVSTVETVKAIQEEVERIRTSEVTDDELKSAKDTALNSLVFAFDTKSKTILRMLNYAYYGYPLDFIQQYQKALSQVTRADVLRVAKARLKPGEFTVLAVGNPEQFHQPLSSLGTVTPVDLTIPEPPAAPAAPTDQASLAVGKQMLQRAQQAVGGADKLEAVHDFTRTATFSLDPSVPNGGGMKVEEDEQWAAPSHLRQDNVLPVGKISAYCDGRTGWLATPQGSQPLPPAQLQQLQGNLFRIYFRMLLSDRIQGRVVNGADKNSVEITQDGEMARLTLDPATGLPQKVTYESTAMSGQPEPVEENYSDFRDVAGVKLPFQIEILQGGKKFAVLAVQNYKINSGLKPEDLSKKP